MAEINKIHLNKSTRMTLNDRFTAIQSTSPNVSQRNVPKGKLRNGGAVGKASLANRKFLARLEQKHKIQTALKLKRRILKAKMPAKQQRMRNRIGGTKRNLTKALRLAPNGKVIRSNSLTNVATMKADLVRPALKRSNSNVNIAGRLGNRRQNNLGGNSSRMSRQQQRPIRRNSVSTQRLSRSRSRSVSNLRRNNSKVNLRRTNSKGNLNLRGNRASALQNNRNNSRARSVSRTRKRSNSISGRLGRSNINRNVMQRRQLQNKNGNYRINNLQQRRILFRRRNSIGGNVGNNSGVKQGRISRPRGRQQQQQQVKRGRSRSRSRARDRFVQGRRGNVKANAGGQRGNQRGRVRGRSRVRGARVSKPDIKKEDLDKELDQYMANTKTALDKEMDSYMTGSN